MLLSAAACSFGVTVSCRASKLLPIPGQPIDERLAAVLDGSETACHIAVQGRVSDGHFTLVARGQQHTSRLVRYRHQEQSATPRLNIFFGCIGLAFAKYRIQLRNCRLIHGLYRNHVIANTQRRCLQSRILLAHIGRVSKRHHYGAHAIRTNRIVSDGRNQRRINPAGQAKDNARETVLGNVVTGACD